MQHILRLQPDIIKLDMSLTRDIDTLPAHRALAAAIVAFVRAISAYIVAEGVETAKELETLRSLGVFGGQGYLLGKPGKISVECLVPGWKDFAGKAA